MTADPRPETPMAPGERRKLAAHAVLTARREVYVLRGRRALLLALLCRGTATADDVRRAVELPEGIDPVCLGSVPRHLARAGIVRAAGYAMSTRPEAHGRPVMVWTLADRAAALAWLMAHPEPLEPDPVEPAPTAAPARDGAADLFGASAVAEEGFYA